MMPWCRVKRGAKYADCSERTFREWCASGMLRHTKVNGTIRTRTDWIDEFLGKHEINPQDECASVDEMVDEVLKDF